MSQISRQIKPNYTELVRFLIAPLLESPDTLSVDCEEYNEGRRVWLRLDFNTQERGKVYGRGGRNIQSIRTLLKTAAKIAGQSLSLEIHENPQQQERFRKTSSAPKRSSPRS
jgi:predicted RNA-binding protein YlqC (UPF0109 family)